MKFVPMAIAEVIIKQYTTVYILDFLGLADASIVHKNTQK